MPFEQGGNVGRRVEALLQQVGNHLLMEGGPIENFLDRWKRPTGPPRILGPAATQVRA
jgi:hypothetical protein